MICKYLNTIWLVLAIVMTASAVSARESVKIVVNSSNSITTLSRSEVTRIFLKKQQRWANGGLVEPVDLTTRSPTRAIFSDLLLNKDVAAVKSYWQMQIFSGRAVPPLELGTEAEVQTYLKNHPNGIGYVVTDTEIADGLKVLTIDD